MSKPMKIMLMIVSVIFGLIFGWYLVKTMMFRYFMAHYTPPPVTISATTASTKTWKSFMTSIGTLTAVNGVDISSEASGIVKEINFDSGQFVKKGQRLVLLDTAMEEAQLKNDIAKQTLAQINYNRDKILLKKNVVAQSVVDTDLAQLQQAESGVAVTQTKIKQKTITAPFDGRIGIRSIDLGQYLAAGTVMVTLQSLDPLYVQFNLPEQYLPQLYTQQPIDVNVNVDDGAAKSIRGTISAINSKVDQTTRNLLVQGTIQNKKNELLPGMFALVKVWLRSENNVIVLPQTAISYSLHGDSVFLIKENGKDKNDKPILEVTRQYVQVGERRGNEVEVTKGIQAGDQVVTSGQLKLQNGTHVIIDNSVEI